MGDVDYRVPADLTGKIQTVTGLVDPATLGVCLTQSEDDETRVAVQLQSGRKIKVLPKNLAVQVRLVSLFSCFSSILGHILLTCESVF